MVKFVLDAFDDTHAFDRASALDDDILNCFSWLADRSAAEAMRSREVVMQAIENDAKKFRSSGQAARVCVMCLVKRSKFDRRCARMVVCSR